MESNYDFIYKECLQKHKDKMSITGGVKKRLNNTIQYRKSCRRTGFDVGRDISNDEIPGTAPLTGTQLALEQRKQRLEKWKEEREKKKREAAKQKKKPFVTGVHHAPLSYMPPPPIPRARPSTSGRVTRSATRAAVQLQSFAPKNATFRPPKLAISSNLSLPQNLQKRNEKNKNSILTFNPIPPNTLESTRSQTNMSTKPAAGTSYRMTRSRRTIATISNIATKKISPKKHKQKTPNKTVQISQESDFGYNGSSSDYSPVILQKESVSKQKEIPKVLMESPILPSTKTPRRSLPKATVTVTPKSNIPKSESSSEERLRSPKEKTETKSPKEVMVRTPEQILEANRMASPRVTVSRGKSNARKEFKIKLREGLLQDEDSDLENVDHFRRQLESEVARISALCDSWEDHNRQTDLPDLAQEQVLGTVGQARLLMSSKFQQFAGLVDKCESDDDAATGLITPADLQGFWDMVCLQIKNVDGRFKKLEELRQRDWREEQPVVEKKAAKNKAGRRPRPGPGARPAAGPSRLREMIAAARKKQQSSSEQSSAPPTEGSEDKTFEAGFFSVKSPVRTPVPRTPAVTPADTPAGSPAGTPARRSLLKNVLYSEAKKASASKNTTSSFAMLRASSIGKNVEIEGITPLQQTPKLPPIDLNATPARSILKAAHNVEKSGKKSIKTVLFDQSHIENDSSPLDKDKIPGDNVAQTDLQVIDNGVAIDAIVDTSQNKENSSRRQSKIVRQDAIDNKDTPIMTRNRRKSAQTPKQVETEEKPKRSTRRSTKVLQEMDGNPIEEPTVSSAKRRSSARKNVQENMEVEESKMVTTRRSSSRLSKMSELSIVTLEPNNTPRSVRRRGKKSEN